MKSSEPFVITIGHMFGSGGAQVGELLAKKLNILYLDSEIVNKVAEKLRVSEAEIAKHDEKTDSLFQLITQASKAVNDSIFTAPRYFITTDHLVYDCESEVIEQISKERSAVILGRGASNILRDHKRHISVFLYADIESRKKRVQELYKVDDKAALKLIAEYDKKRNHYYKVFTGHEITDLSQYAICLDTSKIGIDDSLEIILKYAEQKFDVVRTL